MKQLPNEFFKRDSVEVARDLLGKVIGINNQRVRIVETEAYGKDQASHAFKRTERSALMFDTYGHIYTYLIYGMYWCLNFTTNPINEAGAVLIRAVEPLDNFEELKKRRNNKKIENLCSGPGKLCQALNINKTQNGLQLGNEIKVFDDGFSNFELQTSSRIGIKDALDLEWRFYIKNNKFVSKG